MFNIKSIVKQITERSKESNTETPSRISGDTCLQKAEGFLCPKCMKQLPSPWELQSHYESVHDEEASEINIRTLPAVPSTHPEEEQNVQCSVDQDMFLFDVSNSSPATDVPLPTNADDLRERLQQALHRKATLESRVVRLVQNNATLKAAADDMDRELSQLRERHKILEAQLAHRESIDDAAVLRQELVQVQRVMDEMNREREKERDELKAKLLQLQESDSDPLIEILKSSLTVKEEECKKLTDELNALKNEYACEMSKLSNEKNTDIASGLGMAPNVTVDCPEDTAETKTEALVHEACLRNYVQAVPIPSPARISTPIDQDVGKTENFGADHVDTDSVQVRDQLRNELMGKNEELKRILREVDITKQNMSSQSKTIETMKQEHKELCDMLNREKNTRVDLTMELKKLSEEKSHIETELQNSLKECSVARRTLTHLQQSLLELQHEYQNVQLEHEQKIEQLGVTMQEKCTLLEKQEDAVQLLVTERAELIQRVDVLETEKMRESKENSLLLEKLQNQLAQNADMQKHLEDCMLSETKKSHCLQDQLNTLTESSNITVQRKNEEIKTLSAALDEVTGEKLALEAKLEASGIEQQKLLERCYATTSEVEALQHTVAELRRKWEESESALQDLGRENATLQLDIEKLLARKWTEDGDVTQCTLCLREFTMLLRKHHCRNCGQIFCNECSAKTAAVVSNKKPVRVCDSCYTELRTK